MGGQGLSSASEAEGGRSPGMMGLCLPGTCSSAPWAAGTWTWDSGQLLRLACAWARYSARLPRAEGADPVCGRVGVCMSVDRSDTHSHTHTHTPAPTQGPRPHRPPPRTCTPSRPLPGGAPRAKSPLPAPRAGVAGQGSTTGSPAPREGLGVGCPGLLPLGPSSREHPAVPPRHVGRSSRDAAGARAGRETRGGKGAVPPAGPAPQPEAPPHSSGAPAALPGPTSWEAAGPSPQGAGVGVLRFSAFLSKASGELCSFTGEAPLLKSLSFSHSELSSSLSLTLSVGV